MSIAIIWNGNTKNYGKWICQKEIATIVEKQSIKQILPNKIPHPCGDGHKEFRNWEEYEVLTQLHIGQPTGSLA